MKGLIVFEHEGRRKLRQRRGHFGNIAPVDSLFQVSRNTSGISRDKVRSSNAKKGGLRLMMSRANLLETSKEDTSGAPHVGDRSPVDAA